MSRRVSSRALKTTKHRVVIFFTSDGFYHVYTDPGVEVLMGHEEIEEYVVYKDNPIEEDWLAGDVSILLPPASPHELDPVNKLVLEMALHS